MNRASVSSVRQSKRGRDCRRVRVFQYQVFRIAMAEKYFSAQGMVFREAREV